MKHVQLHSLLALCMLTAPNVPAAERYVDVNSASPTPPYTNWATAAVTIQDAVDAAMAGDQILVTNGVYEIGLNLAVITGAVTTNRVVVEKLLSLQSVNGPEFTVINGSGNVRCIYLGSGANLAGFTLKNGMITNAGWPTNIYTVDMANALGGGGVWCESTNSVVSNCVFVVNRAAAGGAVRFGTLRNCVLTRNIADGGNQFYGLGGGVIGSVLFSCTLSGNSGTLGGGAYQSTLYDCLLTTNSVWHSGGGASESTLFDCVLTRNTAGLNGGGVVRSSLSNCTLSYNSAGSGGGGAHHGCRLTDCFLIGNSAIGYGGAAAGVIGGGWPYDRCLLLNCVLRNNTAEGGGGVFFSDMVNCVLDGNSATGGGGAAEASRLWNCTVVGNSAGSYGGGASARFGWYAALRNCILYGNTAPTGPNFYSDTSDRLTFDYCCTTPMPTNGIGNITNTPLFVDRNRRLQSNSPCINAGRNEYDYFPYLLTSTDFSTDLDGKPRISGGTMDMGAYEFQSPASMLSYAWAQQYGLPTDGSADYSDSDSDRMNNWQEWITRTIPTDALSALRLLGPSNGASGVTLSWQSVSNRTYFLERATNLGAASPFSLVTSNIVGQADTTSYTDTNAVGSGSFFYRVGVQP